MAQLHFPSNFVAQRRFDLRPELIRINEEWCDDKNQQNDYNDDGNNDERLFRARHRQTTEGASIITHSAGPRLVKAALLNDYVLAHNRCAAISCNLGSTRF